MGREEAIKIIKDLRPEINDKFDADIIGLFGSFARAEETTESDIDLLVEFHKRATLFNLSALKIYLEEKLSRNVDIVTKAALRKEIAQYVENDLIYI
ncbi:MAG: nucleotidyltransferase family protein [Bacteroidetes bacterium]|nr:nucleotidyltransferase family protein [Bacteroidota bacterium]